MNSTIQLPRFALRLPGQEQATFLLLFERGEQSSEVIKAETGAGNVSAIVRKLNARFQNWNEPYRIVCNIKTRTTTYGTKGWIGHWRLVNTSSQPEQVQEA